MSANFSASSAVAIAAFLVAGSAVAVEYKGVPLGATEAAFRAVHPSFKCGTSSHQYADRSCVLRGGTYAGVPAKETFAHFEGDRLCSVHVVVTFDNFLAVKDALTEAHGSPTKTESKALSASAAPHKNNWTFTWKKGREQVEVRSYAYGFNSAVELKTDACLDDRERLQRERTKRRAKDL
jgi:hypothetical protein